MTLLVWLAVSLKAWWPAAPDCRVVAPAWTLAVADARYAPWLDCGALQVLATDHTDSALRDLTRLATTTGYQDLAARTAVALVVRVPSHPVTAADVWPTPPGNLYAAFDVALPPAAAAVRCGTAARETLQELAPELRLTQTVSPADSALAWAEVKAAVAGGERVVAGIAVLPGPKSRGRCGIDLHLRASAADYGVHAAQHASLLTLTGRAASDVQAMAGLAMRLQAQLYRNR